MRFCGSTIEIPLSSYAAGNSHDILSWMFDEFASSCHISSRSTSFWVWDGDHRFATKFSEFDSADLIQFHSLLCARDVSQPVSIHAHIKLCELLHHTWCFAFCCSSEWLASRIALCAAHGQSSGCLGELWWINCRIIVAIGAEGVEDSQQVGTGCGVVQGQGNCVRFHVCNLQLLNAKCDRHN